LSNGAQGEYVVVTLGSTPESELIGVFRTHLTLEVDKLFQENTRREFTQTTADSDGSVIVWVLPVSFLLKGMVTELQGYTPKLEHARKSLRSKSSSCFAFATLEHFVGDSVNGWAFVVL
jgi:hypothetical protein